MVARLLDHFSMALYRSVPEVLFGFGCRNTMKVRIEFHYEHNRANTDRNTYCR